MRWLSPLLFAKSNYLWHCSLRMKRKLQGIFCLFICIYVPTTKARDTAMSRLVHLLTESCLSGHKSEHMRFLVPILPRSSSPRHWLSLGKNEGPISLSSEITERSSNKEQREQRDTQGERNQTMAKVNKVFVAEKEHDKTAMMSASCHRLTVFG